MFPLQQFTDFIKKNALFNQEDRILLAVSGGKDSMVMVQLFKLAGLKFSIAHCNFNLRADEAQRDEAFVKLLANKLNVPFHVVHFDTKAYAIANQVSTQMAARALRYQWFEAVRQAGGYDYIALAQHQNDSIETLLLNLVRGTGISGMHGILPKRDRLVRPLLFLTRPQIDQLVETNQLDFVEDSSNESTKYARNKVRLDVIPHLRQLNPKLEETFAQNIVRFAETEAVLQQVVALHRTAIFTEKQGNVYASVQKVKQLEPQRLLFFELLRPYHFTASVVDEILNALEKQSGTSFYSSSHRATMNRNEIVISVLEAPKLEFPICIHPHDQEVQIGRQLIKLDYSNSNAIEHNALKAFVDFDQLIFPLVLRFRQPGDKFVPFGMRQHQKLSDFLINSKVALPDKDKVPLLINGNGEMIWVAGLRQDNRYKVNATTKKVAIFELLN